LAGKIDAILKLTVVASMLFASSSVGYYYLVHLPRREAQFEPERVLERLRAAAQKRAEQEQLLFNNKLRNNERRNNKPWRSGKPWRRPIAIKPV
jgi:hypothetical protein